MRPWNTSGALSDRTEIQAPVNDQRLKSSVIIVVRGMLSCSETALKMQYSSSILTLGYLDHSKKHRRIRPWVDDAVDIAAANRGVAHKTTKASKELISTSSRFGRS